MFMHHETELLPIEKETTPKQEPVTVPPIGLQWLGLNEAQEDIYKTQLKGDIHIHESFGTDLRNEEISESIRQFILESDLYDMRDLGKGRWHKMATAALSKRELYSPLCEVVRSVFAYFKHGPTRSVVVTSHHKFYHEAMANAPGSDIFKSAPDITITGSGEIFPPLLSPSSASYLNCVSAVDVELEDDRDFMRDIIQASVFARQCFIQQHNRKYAYVLAVSESKARLYVFDRAGVCCSMNTIDIHQRPGDFVRFILAISSPDDDVVGFDTEVYWKGGNRFVDAMNERHEFVSYQILGGRPLAMRKNSIRGRGSCCWEVMDPDGNILIVKDTWTRTDRHTEAEFLHDSVGLDGTAQMIAYKHGFSTWDLRGIAFEATTKMKRSTLHDRTFSRMILKHGGKPLERFDTAEEVLFGMRDAILGHKRLWDKGILHRDISLNNILLGPPGNRPGCRGTLIDLDIAEWITEDLPIGSDRVGTRLTQSIHVLKSRRYNGEGTKRKMLHDYLDDLEGFYYSLSYVTHSYSGPGEILRPFPAAIDAWRTNNAEDAAKAKLAFIKHNMLMDVQVTPFFGKPFENLICKLSVFLWSSILDKLDFYTLNLATLSNAKGHSIEDYKTVIGYFDEAIVELASLRAAPSATPVRFEKVKSKSSTSNTEKVSMLCAPSLDTPLMTARPSPSSGSVKGFKCSEGKLALKRKMDFEDNLAHEQSPETLTTHARPSLEVGSVKGPDFSGGKLSLKREMEFEDNLGVPRVKRARTAV